MRELSRQGRSNHAGDLQRVGRELAEWRRTHHAPSRIPETVWARAVRLAAQEGVSVVARALRLNHTQLKRRMEVVPAVESTPTFIELLPSVAANIGECAVEVESHRGARMRIVMKNVSPVCLAGILRDFAR